MYCPTSFINILVYACILKMSNYIIKFIADYVTILTACCMTGTSIDVDNARIIHSIQLSVFIQYLIIARLETESIKCNGETHFFSVFSVLYVSNATTKCYYSIILCSVMMQYSMTADSFLVFLAV